jgi:Protein phosphatase 2C
MGLPLTASAPSASPAAAPAGPSLPPGWRVVGASVRGTSHARSGLPCQDAHAWAALPGGALAIAVADGAGTAPRAEEGARAAADAAAASLAAATRSGMTLDGWTVAVDRALDAARDAVLAEAARLDVDPRELAATLIVAVASAEGVAAAQVGDGAVVAADADGLHALTHPVSGEFANETVFLTTPEALSGAQRAAWRRAPLHLAVLTDGLQPLALKLPGREPHAPFFAPLFRFASESADSGEAGEQLAAFLSGPRVAARADDDLTLVLAARHP